jgi:hypothetical protein
MVVHVKKCIWLYRKSTELQESVGQCTKEGHDGRKSNKIRDNWGSDDQKPTLSARTESPREMKRRLCMGRKWQTGTKWHAQKCRTLFLHRTKIY